jgi:uncharacterized protein (TIGR01777 family)
MKILITGATGFIGKALVSELIDRDCTVNVLTRNPTKAAGSLPNACFLFPWNPTKELPPKGALEGCDAVIHLAGESVATKKWTKSQKNKIASSRIESTKNLIKAIAELREKPKIFLSASGIGFYGDCGEKIVSEEALSGEGFLAHTCFQWEEEALKAFKFGMRTIVVRTGIVLEKNGGMLARLLPMFQHGFGGMVGNGKQWMSWIHLKDLVDIYIYLLTHKNLKGVFNGAAPCPITNKDFTKLLGTALNKPTFCRVPSIFLKIALGEMSHLFLDSTKTSSAKIESSGFRFNYPSLELALKKILN